MKLKEVVSVTRRKRKFYVESDRNGVLTLRPLASGIKGQRQRLGLTQMEMAKRLGLHHVTLCRIERGILDDPFET